MSNLFGLALSNGAAWTTRYTYDAERRWKTLTPPAGTFNYNYFQAGQTLPPTSPLVTSLVLGNGALHTSIYDGLGQLQETVGLARWDYGYNGGGQRTSSTRSDDNGKPTRSFLYDQIGQLTNVATTDNFYGSSLEQFAYAYDAAGNLTRRVKNTLTNAFTPDALNQLSTASRTGTLAVGGYTTTNVCAVAVNGLAATLYGYNTYEVAGIPLVDGTNTLTAIAQDGYWRRNTNTVTAYWPATATCQNDLNGSLVWDGKKRLDYDPDNQLIAVTFTNAVQSKFVYDGLSRLRIRREYTWLTNQWKLTNEVRYVYDHSLVVQERDSNNVAKVSYTRGADLSGSREGLGGIGGLLALTQNSATNQHFFYDDDGVGNVTGMTDANLNQVAYYLYDPFGNTIFASGPMATVNPYRSFSKELFLNPGLIYFGRRFYDPSLQRFLNQDPIQELGGINLYRFAGNSPLNRIDPTGLSWFSGLGDALVSPISRLETGAAQAQGAAGLKDQLERAGYVDMKDFMQANQGYNGDGSLGIQAAANITAGAAHLYLDTAQQIAIGGIVTKGASAAASGVGEAAESGLWQRFKKFCFGKKSPKPPEPPRVIIAEGAGYESQSLGGKLYTGGYDPAQNTLYLGDAGHGAGMSAAGGTAIPGVTPGITVVDTPSGVRWANDSASLPQALTSDQAAQIQAALQAQFPGKPVAQVRAVE